MTQLQWLTTKLHHLRGYGLVREVKCPLKWNHFFLLIFLWFRGRIAKPQRFWMLSQSHKTEQIWLKPYGSSKSGESENDCWCMGLYHRGVTPVFKGSPTHTTCKSRLGQSLPIFGFFQLLLRIGSTELYWFIRLYLFGKLTLITLYY